MASEVIGGVKLLAEAQVKGNAKAVVVDSDRVRGGNVSAADIAERNAIPADARKEGATICYVVSEEKHYYLKGGIDNANWTEFG